MLTWALALALMFFLSAKWVGARGKVIGIDMTDEMLEKQEEMPKSMAT